MSRIVYAKLKNMIGIYNGTGKTEIELDFSKGTNRVVVLAGENGSGKSTIQSMLHPFAETMDNRSDIVLKGKDGFKEIRIEHEGSTYKIEHHYNNKGKRKSVKSFISKWMGGHWEELNENGNVTSFKEMVAQELDVDENLFRLLHIGSNVDGFIKMKTAERKKFMSKFLPDIEEYIYYYKIVSEKFTDLKRKIQTIVDDMKKLDTEEHLLTMLEGTENQIKSREAKKERLTGMVNRNLGKISQLDPDGSVQAKHEELQIEYDTYFDKSENLKKSLERMVATTPKLGEYDSSLKVEKAASGAEQKAKLAENEVKNLTSSKKRLAEEIVSLGNDLAEKELELSKYKTDKNLDEYLELRDKYEKRLKVIQKEIKKDYSDLAKLKVDIDTLDQYDKVLSTLCSKIDVTASAYPLSVVESILNGADKSALSKVVSETAAEVGELEEELRGLERKVSFYAGKADMSDVLEMRPGNCKIDSCGFIAEALKNKDAGKNRDKYEKLVSKCKDSLEVAKQAHTEAAEALTAHHEIERIWEYVEDNSKLLSRFPNAKNFDSQESFYKFFTKNKDKFLDTSRVRELCHLKDEQDKIESSIMPDIVRNIELLESKAGIIESLKKDIAKIKAKVGKNREELSEVSDSLNEQTKRQTTFTAIAERFRKYAEIMGQHEETVEGMTKVSERAKEIEDTMAVIVSIRHKNDEAMEEIEVLDSEITPLQKELDRIKFNLEKIKEYTAKKKDLDDNLSNVTAVRDALSPTKGIPLLFIDVYLRQTKTIANKLLDIAWGGKFFLDSFELTDSDFFIRAKKESGEVVEDVSLASQGEKALSSIALSMALMQQAMRKYNVVSLDEIDAELDEKNRRSFVEILDKQLEELGIEQVFIITHNREFDSYPVDLILMPDHGLDIKDKSYMRNKTIIYKAV